jgi:diguanylate cyclase (GGDEF)-like protein
MRPPAIPIYETERLAALRALAVLDTPAEERFDRITRLATRIFGAPIALVSLVDDKRQWFKSAQGFPLDETDREISFCGHAINGEDAFIISDAAADERFHDNPLVTGETHIRFYSGYPLRSVTGANLGTLCVMDRAPREFDRSDIKSLQDLAALVEAELHRQQLSAVQQQLLRELNEAERRASLDCMTRLWNRGYMLRLLESELSAAAESGGSVQAAMIDVDNFKQVNNNHGHPVGDEVLREVAARLRRNLRPADTLGRYGGEEFLLVMTACTQAAAQSVTERILRTVSAEPIASKAGPLPVTVSLGLSSCLPQSKSELGALIEAADRALYEAKHGGRNRVCSAPEAVWPGS